MANVTISQVHVSGGDGTALYDDEQLTLSAECVNNDSEPLSGVTVSLTMGGQYGSETFDLAAGESRWAQAVVGPLAAGGYDLEASVGAEVDSSSRILDSNGLSVSVQSRGGGDAGGGGLGTEHPSASITSIHIQPHTNIEHEADQAFSTERIRIAVNVQNDGSSAFSGVQVIIRVGDQTETHDTQLAASASDWFYLEAEPLPAGQHQVEAWVTAELPDQSAVLAHEAKTLTVTEAAAGTWLTVNAQFRVLNFQGTPMRGYRLFSKFTGMDGSDAYGGETVEASQMSGGVQTCTNIQVQPEGTVSLMAVSEGEAAPLLEGLAPYKVEGDDTNIAFTVTQGQEEVTRTATSEEELSRMLGVEASAGVTIEVLEIGGKVATEETRSRTYGEGIEWKVRIGTEQLTISQTS